MRKKTILTMALWAFTVLGMAQNMMHVYRNDGQYFSFVLDDQVTIDYEYDQDGNCISQVIHASDTTYVVPLESVVSLSFADEEDMHPHAVDLGLPSGTKWASCNIGASAPEVVGDFYAWGEDFTKDNYWWWTYTYFDNETYDITNIGDNICGTEYDVSRSKWGAAWQLPSHVNIVELINLCSKKVVTVEGVGGMLFTGPNGNTIFLPLGGSYLEENIINPGVLGEYWTGTISSYDDGFSKILYLISGNAYTAQSQMCIGRNVRPVIHKEE